MAKTPDKLAARLDAVVAEREKPSALLWKAQDKLRGIDRQDAAYADEVAVVNELKAEIGRISIEHAELARAVSLVSGGTNHAPPAGISNGVPRDRHRACRQSLRRVDLRAGHGRAGSLAGRVS
jgi:hypothetical protein